MKHKVIETEWLKFKFLWEKMDAGQVEEFRECWYMSASRIFGLLIQCQETKDPEACTLEVLTALGEEIEPFMNKYVDTMAKRTRKTQ